MSTDQDYEDMVGMAVEALNDHADVPADWATEVDWQVVDVDSLYNCPLGQIFGGYHNAPAGLRACAAFGYDGEMDAFGYAGEMDEGDRVAYHNALTAAWKRWAGVN